MICQICKKRDATIHFTNVVGNKVEKIHICSHCAEEKGFDYLKKSNFAMGDLLSGLLSSAAKAVERKDARGQCSNCGMTFSRFKKGGRLGCPECYEVFRKQLLPLLRSVHGETRHVGKVPNRFGEEVTLKRRVLELRKELSRAIEMEEYERAAEIRDEIRSLDTFIGEGNG